MEKVSAGFKLFMSETDGVGEAFMGALFQLSDKSHLDKKTHELAYLSVLVATRLYGGLPFHIEQAMRLGASEEEIRSAMLVPLPVVGISVAEALPYLVKIQAESQGKQS